MPWTWSSTRLHYIIYPHYISLRLVPIIIKPFYKWGDWDSGTFDTYPMSHREKVPEPGFKSRFYFTPKVGHSHFRVLSPQCTNVFSSGCWRRQEGPRREIEGLCLMRKQLSPRSATSWPDILGQIRWHLTTIIIVTANMYWTFISSWALLHALSHFSPMRIFWCQYYCCYYCCHYYHFKSHFISEEACLRILLPSPFTWVRWTDYL